MRRSTGLLGFLGVVLLLFAGMALYFTRFAAGVDRIYILLHAIGGILALIAYFSAGVDNVRTFLGERSTKYGTSTVLASLFFIVILVAVNYLSSRHHKRFDLTAEHVFSLSAQSVSVVKSLDKDLVLRAFVEGGSSPELQDLFDSYRYASPKVSAQMVDPDRQPELAEKFHISAYNTVHLEYGENTTAVTQPSEETITNAIIKLTRATQQTVCFIEGHGEPDTEAAQDAHGYSQARGALANENYQVKRVLLATLEKIPDDCSLVAVVGPERPYEAREVKVIEDYVHSGKRAFFLLAPQQGEQFAPLLSSVGIKLGNDVVVDQVVRLFQGPALGLAPLAETYAPEHEITREFKQRTIFPMSRSVQKDGETPGWRVSELVKTSASSWAETDITGIFERQEAKLDESDRKGPVSVAAVTEASLKPPGTPGEGAARLAVFGSVEFADNRNLTGSFFNRDLFLNTVGWLVGQSDLLSIRPRAMRASRVNFTRDEGTVIFYLSVLLLPELLLLAGLAVWWRRE